MLLGLPLQFLAPSSILRLLVSPENMKLKELEGFLGGLAQFPHPKVELEQYSTGPYIASRMLFTAENSFGDVSDKVVTDFGCGCGTLGIAAALLGAKHVLSIDIDPESLEIASLNAEELELDMDFIQSNVLDLGWRGPTVDTVIMNPSLGKKVQIWIFFLLLLRLLLKLFILCIRPQQEIM